MPFFLLPDLESLGKMACFGSKKFGNFVIVINVNFVIMINVTVRAERGFRKKMWEMELLMKEGKY